MPDSAAFCPGCGRAATAPPPAPLVATTRGLPDNILGMLAYVTFVPALIFLLVEPFNKNRFIRFHSFQCLFLSVAGPLIAYILKIASLILFLVPFFGHLLAWLLSLVVLVGWFILWIVLLLKAYQGEMFKLPFVGNLAEKQANRV